MPGSTPPADTWELGDIYESYIGRWSRPVARAFLDWLAVPEGRRWLDVGCGAGALTEAVVEHAQPSMVCGLDASEGFVAYARRRVSAPRVTFRVGDALELPFEPGAFDAAVSGLVLNFVNDPAAMVAEMARVTAPGGVIAVYVWDYAGDMEMLRVFWDAAVHLDPAAAELDEGRRFPLCQRQPLHDLFEQRGLDNVEVRPLDVPTVFPDFDDYWTPFLGGQGPAPAYVRTLREEQQVALREHLRNQLPIRPDGSVHLRARAWAARGTR